MKRFIKDGIIKFQNQILIKHGEFTQIINPPEHKILEDGWVEYVETIDNFDYEKKNMLLNAENFSNSANIKVFYINDEPFWFNNIERITLKHKILAEIEKAQSTTNIWYNGTEYFFDIDFFNQILTEVEIYASKCFDTTQRNLNEIKNLSSIEELENFDFTKNYPEILQFYSEPPK